MNKILLALLANGSTVVSPPLPTDPDFADVALLLHCDGPVGSSLFVDSSVNQFDEIAPEGEAVLTDALPKFGSACAVVSDTFNATAYDSGTLVIGTEDYTAEGWVKITAVTGFSTVWLYLSGGSLMSDAFGLGVVESAGDPVLFYVSPQNWPLGVNGVATLVVGQWHHVAVSRNTGTTRGFLDGELQFSTPDTTDYTNTGLAKFISQASSQYMGDTFYDEFRLTIGTGRYTSSFTPPTEPFPNM